MEGFRRFLRRLRRRVQVAAVGVYAANASFFILLSLFPGTMLLLGLLQYTALTTEGLYRAISGFVPPELLPLLDYMLRELFASDSPALLSVSAVTALWSASRGVYSLILGMNRVCRVRETRNYLVLRLRCALYTVLLLAALIASLGLQFLGEQALAGLEARGFFALTECLRHRHLIVLPFLTLFFSLVYLSFPNKRMGFAAVLPGAVFSALGWVTFSFLFSFYVNRFGNFSLYYGSLSVIALTMLWLYACLCILFYGGMLNDVLWNRKQRRT